MQLVGVVVSPDTDEANSYGYTRQYIHLYVCALAVFQDELFEVDFLRH